MASLNDGRTSVNVIANKTLVAADSGIVQNVQADGITITLPATAANLCYTIRNGGVPPTSGPAGAVADQAILVNVAPNASDGFTGLGFTAATNKTAQNTKATAKVGDQIEIIGSGTTGVTAWQVRQATGTWVRGA